MNNPIAPVSTVIDYIQRKQLSAGKAMGGFLIHVWRDGNITYCGKSNLVRNVDRLFDWKVSRPCRECLAEVEKIMRGEQ